MSLTLVAHGHTWSALNCLAHYGMGHLNHLKSGPAPCKPSHLLGDKPELVKKKRLGPHGEGLGKVHWGIIETEADEERGLVSSQQNGAWVSPFTLQNLETSVLFTEFHRSHYWPSLPTSCLGLSQ